MRIAITGYKGQLGQELCQTLQSANELILFDLPEHDITSLDISIEIAQAAPDLVIHSAAMTDVDGCTLDPDAAFAINALGTRNVVLGCQKVDAAMVYISTNEVFDGTKVSPYLEFDAPNPINMYGHTKLAGEQLVSSLLNRYYIVRTSWLFGLKERNFVNRIVELANEHGELKVVTDEIASPSYARDVATAISRLITTGAYGIYHFTNSGSCSRFEFAHKILELADQDRVPVHPITLDQYSRPSRPPGQSALQNFCGAALGITLRPWQEAVEDYLKGR